MEDIIKRVETRKKLTKILRKKYHFKKMKARLYAMFLLESNFTVIREAAEKITYGKETEVSFAGFLSTGIIMKECRITYPDALHVIEIAFSGIEHDLMLNESVEIEKTEDKEKLVLYARYFNGSGEDITEQKAHFFSEEEKKLEEVLSEI